MSDNQKNLRESLSALMDGEAEQLESKRLERELSQSAELKAYWSRQQLIRQALHKELEGQADFRADIAAAVREQLEREADHQLPQTPAPDASAVAVENKRQPLIGFAIAASVALAVFLGFQGQQATLDSPALTSPVVAKTYVPAGNVQTVSLGSTSNKATNKPVQSQYLQSRAQVPAEMAAHLQRYYTEHAEQAAFSGSYGLLPYARTSGEF